MIQVIRRNGEAKKGGRHMNKNAMVIIIICLLVSWAILALLQKFTGAQVTKSSASSSLE